MEQDTYRFVPYRFLINNANTDVCKLERLTNLFPDMKGIIELELFKINNMTNMVNRLSNIYTVSTAVDTRDDTQHLFLGPYHLTLGPAIFGAMQFKNISKALIDSTNAKKFNNNENTKQSSKRRRDFVLRRFRRAARKLILIKSIIDQLRFASILTPFNQDILHTNGIYDLVLAGHKHSSQIICDHDDCLFTDNFEHQKTTFASKFIKVNTLLNLLSTISNQSDTLDNNNSRIRAHSQNVSDNANIFPNNDNHSNSLIDSSGICCVPHSKLPSFAMLPIRTSIGLPQNHFLSPDTVSKITSYNTSRRSSIASKQNSNYNSSRRSSLYSRQSVRSSLPDLNVDDNSNTRKSFKEKHSSYSTGKETDTSKGITTLNLRRSSRISRNSSFTEEDTFINHMSSLFTSYLISQQPTTISSHDSNQSLTTSETTEFDKIFDQIKTIVNNRLTVINKSNNHHQQLEPLHTDSYQETSINQLNIDRLMPSTNKNKLDLLKKSQSFDDNNLQLFSMTHDYITRF